MTASAFILSYRSLRSQIMINRIRDEFISNISHELKTPVATVKLALEAIDKFKGGLSDETVSDYLNIASLETERLDRLVTKVLDYGRIEGGGNGFNLQREDLMAVVQEAVESMKARSGGEGTIISLQGDDQLHLMADSLYLGGVFVNIMDNSLKYGIKPVVIDISVIREGKIVTVIISDNGPGIPEEYIGKVFDKFFRVPSDNLHNVKGYGLGLSFAKMVVESHGGTIAARNNPEGGCSFIVSLPVND
jgi:two-component system phosphate regulon sensor histidine kinase PhoR